MTENKKPHCVRILPRMWCCKFDGDRGYGVTPMDALRDLKKFIAVMKPLQFKNQFLPVFRYETV